MKTLRRQDNVIRQHIGARGNKAAVKSNNTEVSQNREASSEARAKCLGRGAQNLLLASREYRER